MVFFIGGKIILECSLTATIEVSLKRTLLRNAAGDYILFTMVLEQLRCPYQSNIDKISLPNYPREATLTTSPYSSALTTPQCRPLSSIVPQTQDEERNKIKSRRR